MKAYNNNNNNTISLLQIHGPYIIYKKFLNIYKNSIIIIIIIIIIKYHKVKWC